MSCLLRNFSVLVAGLAGMASVIAQVRITDLSSGGILSWENPVTNTVHEVQRAGNPAGPWETVGWVTNQNWFQLTNSLGTDIGAQFLRVSWAGGTAWVYEGRDGRGGLLATGQVYLIFDKAPAVRGSWVMEAVGPIRSRHAIGRGLLTGMMYSNAHLNLDFNPGYVDNNFVTSGAFKTGTNIYSGEWSFSGFAVFDRGSFHAEKMP